MGFSIRGCRFVSDSLDVGNLDGIYRVGIDFFKIKSCYFVAGVFFNVSYILFSEAAGLASV